MVCLSAGYYKIVRWKTKKLVTLFDTTQASCGFICEGFQYERRGHCGKEATAPVGQEAPADGFNQDLCGKFPEILAILPAAQHHAVPPHERVHPCHREQRRMKAAGDDLGGRGCAPPSPTVKRPPRDEAYARTPGARRGLLLQVAALRRDTPPHGLKRLQRRRRNLLQRTFSVLLSHDFSLYHPVKGLRPLRRRRDTPPLTAGASMKSLKRAERKCQI